MGTVVQRNTVAATAAAAAAPSPARRSGSWAWSAVRYVVTTVLWASAVVLLVVAAGSGAMCARELSRMWRHIRPCRDVATQLKNVMVHTARLLEAEDTPLVADLHTQAQSLLPSAVVLCAQPMSHLVVLIVMLMVFCTSLATTVLLVGLAVSSQRADRSRCCDDTPLGPKPKSQ